MNLAKMLERVEYECISGTTDVEITQEIGRASCRDRV